MGAMAGGDSKLTNGRGVLRLTGGDRERESQLPLFIGPEELLAQIDEDKFLILHSVRIRSWQRSKLRHVIESEGNLNLPARLGMPAIDSIEPRHVNPARSKESFQAFASLKTPTMPGDPLITRMMDCTRRTGFSRPPIRTPLPKPEGDAHH